MRWSQTFIPTLRETPSDAEVISHKLMLRAGYIRKLAAGVYTYLPLALRVLRKIETIVRQEMIAGGAEELLLPVVMPAELWIESGRWQVYGKELLRFKDRHERDFCIGPTHEEAITDLVRHEIRSWRDLPKNLFQIQTKFRDEVRPRFGLMRGREFLMKDGYSFDRDPEGARQSYRAMFEAYKKIFLRCGLEFRAVEAMTGNIGGSLSHEFQVLAESGEDEIVACNKCEYAANVEKAEIGVEKQRSREAKKQRKGRYKKVSTPGKRGVEEVAQFLKVPVEKIVKTLLLDTDKGPIAGLVRGDHSIKEAKLKDAFGCEWCHLAEEETIQGVTGASSGYSGPIGLQVPVIADFGLQGMEDFLVGANELDTHLVDVNFGDFLILKFADIRHAKKGDPCPRCEGGQFDEFRGIEVGQVFYLGDKYSKSMGATYLDEKGEKKFFEMGCYGIGIGRTAAAAIEQNHDERGIIWPIAMTPFQVQIVTTQQEDLKIKEVGDSVYRALGEAGAEVLYDDRLERPGVKFADADLVGIPYQMVIGPKGLKDGVVEIKKRQNGSVEKVSIKDAVSLLQKKIQNDIR